MVVKTQARNKAPNTTVVNVMEIDAVAVLPTTFIEAANIAIKPNTIIQPSINVISVGRKATGKLSRLVSSTSVAIVIHTFLGTYLTHCSI